MMKILETLDKIMPLEIWGIAIGLIVGMLLWALFLWLMDSLNNY